MLKRLELIGFKSFAEKTQFDFGPGITAVVGPNGSGKSNVVDAVRWILGEQSAKSLRGGEMADVIFNGSSTRRSLGMAEVTLTLDNTRRRLATDSDEVQVTRRVYRSGEGEYLINKQPARLKDIKEMFLGSGAGADAYSIIEQGRVDVLLQASTRERRVIFEEAAGISRFKAKKIETLRKLERVEQNLQRLRDIVEEVDRQLRSVKLQAAKAERYREYVERLKELRVALSLDEYGRLSDQLALLAADLDGLRERLADHSAQTSRWEAEQKEIEARLAATEQQARTEEAALAGARERIAAAQTTVRHERAQLQHLEQDLAQAREQLGELTRQLAAMTGGVDRAIREQAEIEQSCLRQREETERLEAELAQSRARLDTLREESQHDKVELMEQMRQTARLHNEVVSLRAQAESLAQHRRRLQAKNTQATEILTRLDIEVRQLVQAEEEVQGRLGQSRASLAALRGEREHRQQAAERTSRELAELRERQSALASRIQILDRLEMSHEGLGAGVREVLALAEAQEPGPWRTVAGVVADLIEVSRTHAPLIDLALGDRAQYVLVRDPAMLAEAIRQAAANKEPLSAEGAAPGQFSGRVSFLPVPQPATEECPSSNRLLESSPAGRLRLPATADGLPDHPGLVAAADRLVACSHPDFPHLPRCLLGDTLVVKDLEAARQIAALSRGFRFVTLQGELLEEDGVLTIGTHHAESGILSRKSELRELRDQAAVQERSLAEVESALQKHRERIQALDQQLEEGQQELQVLAEQAADLRSRLQQQRERHVGLAEELSLSHQEMRQLDEELTAVEEAARAARANAAAADQRIQTLQERLETADRETRAQEARRQQEQQACTAAKVALATIEERLAAAQARSQQIERDWQARQEEHRSLEQRLAATQLRRQASASKALAASSDLAQAYVDKEAAETAGKQREAEAASQRQERERRAQQAQAARASWVTLQEQVHSRELECKELEHRIQALCDRLQEEHELDLVLLAQEPRRPEGVAIIDTAAMQEEIGELKKKVSRLGSVNLESLAELEELETRSRTLQGQSEDLISAKAALDEIIARINQDSRKLFTETFETVRSHFQELFRKLFGGGMADILLEDPNDILESGIEIIARPPGKELRSISLLSGGEKTLTAVALLLAVFRSKPSPFCILDEVDAALDEANIGRFSAVLREFLDQSQFIIITHSKKTMATADVLYGVTMQESGVSKRVAVRFEDWPEEEPGDASEDLGPPAGQAESAA